MARGKSRKLGARRSVAGRRSSLCKGPEARGTLAHLRDFTNLGEWRPVGSVLFTLVRDVVEPAIEWH